MEQIHKFFQSEKKFVVGKTYETLSVKSPPYNKNNYVYDLETCDEKGTIIPNTELLLGEYVESYTYGYGDNGGRCDYFINKEGIKISNYLDYNGTTRYREVQNNIKERINSLNQPHPTSKALDETDITIRLHNL